MAEYDLGFRPELRPYAAAIMAAAAAEGGGRSGIISGKVCSATNPTFVTPPRPPLSLPPPDHEHRRYAPIRKQPKPAGGAKWCFSDPEAKRRRRVAGYKAYGVEGKVKASLRNGVRWIKCKCSRLVHGF